MKNKGFSTWLVLIIIIIVGYFIYNNFLRQKVTAESAVTKIKQRMQFPVVMSEDLTIKAVELFGKNEIAFVFTLSKLSSSSPELDNYLNEIKANNTKDSCKNSILSKILNDGISITSIFDTNDNIEVSRITVAPKDCN